jgi:gliding motility associated protien GldN
MKRVNILLLGLISLATSNVLLAQTAYVDSTTTALDYKVEVYIKENIPFKKPIPYSYVREADVMFEKVIWRMVDLREKQNLPLYYPTETIGNRVNLINLLLKGIENGEITAYSPDDGYDEFKRPMSKTELDLKLGARQDTIMVADEEGNMVEEITKADRRIAEVRKMMIKEKIYFDKKHSAINKVVVGICPIRVYSRDGNEDDPSQMEMAQVMWVYMPEARNVLARHPVFNRFNDAQNISFDDFFMQNRYSGYIYSVSNVYNNRLINEYASGIDVMYEAQRIENEIFNIEQDLWEY